MLKHATNNTQIGWQQAKKLYQVNKKNNEIISKQLKSGQHFGNNKNNAYLDGVILSQAEVSSSMIVPWHYHENAYFYYHLQGYLRETNKKQTIECTKGTLLFHNSQDAHYNSKFKTDSRFFHVELEDKWFQKFGIKPHSIKG